ncbi:MAG: amidohydrolase family protein [bacterium]
MTTQRSVFRNGRVIDGRGGVESGWSVAVEGDRIQAVGPDASIEGRPGDHTISIEGRSLMPGMVQSHFHSHFGAFGEGVLAPALGLEAAPPYLSMLAAHNAKTALHCGYTGAIGSSNAHTIDVSLKEAILAGFVEGPRYLAGSHELVTTGEMSDYANNRNFFMELGNTGLTVTANGPDEWRAAARREAGRGCDVIKISASPGHGAQQARDILYLDRDELQACVSATHKLGKKVRAHAPSRTAILECARAGVDIIDHADRIDEECIEAILDAGSFVVPSMLWSTRFLEIAESWDHSEKPLPISEGFPESLETTLARVRSIREDFDYTCRMMPEAARAGVKMIVGDDYGTPIMPHGDYGAELEFYVKHLGLAPLEVLGWATRNGAEAMGLGEQTGTIEAGKKADLLIVEGDPSVDISCLSSPENLSAILLDGRWVRNRLD